MFTSATQFSKFVSFSGCFSGCRWIKRSVSLSPFPFYLHPFAGIQRVYDLLLHILVKRIIQIVDLHNFPKDRLVIPADLRNRIGNDRKASLIPP